MYNLEKIREIADEKNLGIRGLARKVKMAESSVHKLIAVNSTKHKTIVKIAKALDVPVSTFYMDERDSVIRFKIAEEKSPDYGLCSECVIKDKTIDRLTKLLERAEGRIAKCEKELGEYREDQDKSKLG